MSREHVISGVVFGKPENWIPFATAAQSYVLFSL